MPYVKDTFSKLVAKGEAVGVLEVKRSTYHPLVMNQQFVDFDIFCTEDNSVVYTKHPAMRKLGSVTVELPPGWSKGMASKRRREGYSQGMTVKRREPYYPLEVAFQFGTTELRVTATNKQTGEAFETAVAYDEGDAGQVQER